MWNNFILINNIVNKISKYFITWPLLFDESIRGSKRPQTIWTIDLIQWIGLHMGGKEHIMG